MSVSGDPVGDARLSLVDLAGTDDTAGRVAELSGAIYCSSVLQKAGSVRVALVIGLDRAKLCNERGKGIVRDVEHVAALFRDLEPNLGS
eukprot:15417774-Alexandrium_andersonii.AAC.1